MIRGPKRSDVIVRRTLMYLFCAYTSGASSSTSLLFDLRIGPGKCLAQAQKSASEKTKAGGKKPVNVLRLPRGTGVATVISVDANMFRVQGNKFARVAVGDALFVLNKARDGVLARLIVKTLFLDGTLDAELDKAGGGVVASSLLDTPVLHESDALRVREQLGKGAVKVEEETPATGANPSIATVPAAANPTLHVSVGASWEEKNGVLYLLSTPVDASSRTTRVHSEIYAPWIPVTPWVNWFGIEVDVGLPSKGTLAFGDPGQGGYEARHTSNALSLGVGVRPVFDSPLLSRVGLLLNIIDGSMDTVTLSGGPRDETFGSVFERKGMSLEAHAESHPGRLALFAVRYRKPLSTRVKVTEKAPAGETSYTGEASGQTLVFETGVRLPILRAPGGLTWETRAGLEMRSESVKTDAFAGERAFANQAIRLMTGFAWIP